MTAGSQSGGTALDQAQRRLAAARAAKTADVCKSVATLRSRRTRAPLPRHGDSGVHTMLESAMESALPCAMTRAAETLPDDVDALRAALAAEHAAHAATAAAHTSLVAEHKMLAELHAKLEQIVSELRRAHFGRKSERIDDAQFALALEDLETAAAIVQAAGYARLADFDWGRAGAATAAVLRRVAV